MTSGAPDLPIRWTLPEPPIPRLLDALSFAFPIAMLVLGAVQQSWFYILFPTMLLLGHLESRKRPGRREFEVTYAAVYGSARLLFRPSLRWAQVTSCDCVEHSVLLYGRRHLRPIVLELPEDAELRGRILDTIRLKASLYGACRTHLDLS